MANDLCRADWLKAARLALLKGGVEAVRVEPLARRLSVTKGSFYWHFKDRSALLDELLREWEGEMADVVARIDRDSTTDRLRALVDIVVERARTSELGDTPSDAAIFTWASVSPNVARRVNRAERRRIQLLTEIIGEPARAQMLYLGWLGFVARGQRVPGFRRQFRSIANAMMRWSA